MIKLVAFDWNGTLLSDTFASVKADNIALKKLGIKRTITLNEFQKCFHIPISQYWTALGMKRSFFEKHANQIEIIFHDFYEPIADKCRTRTGSKVTLSWLSKNSVQSIIYSNHIKSKIMGQLVRLKLNSFITTILAREQRDNSLLHSRGKEQKLCDYVKKNKLKPQEVVSIGDTEEEIEIGKANGFYTVGITGGYNTAARLKKHRPDFLIHNMKELIPIIKKLNK